MRKTRKKLLAVLLAFTMLFGSSMTVFARDYEWNDLNGGEVLTDQDAVIWQQDYCYGAQKLEVYGSSSGTLADEQAGNGSASVTLRVSVPNGKIWTVDSTASQTPADTPLPYVYKVYVTETNAVPSTNPADEESLSPSTEVPTQIPTRTEPSVPESKLYEHTHSFTWVETVEPSETTDGLMEYKCSCGYVEERSVISGSMSFVKNVVRQIETALENGTVEIKTECYTCYTAYIMDALKKRPDVSLKTSYKDKDGSIKNFTIPAGKAPDDKELFYGFTYLGNLYGWDE